MTSDNQTEAEQSLGAAALAPEPAIGPIKAKEMAEELGGAQVYAQDAVTAGTPPQPDQASAMDGMLSSSSIPLGLADTRSVRARRWSTLESITVRGFKAAEVATIPLDRVTILVGANGCGKSSVLQAIHWSARAASYVLPKNTKEMISFERLDYVPSSEPLTTLHKGELKSDAGSTPVEVIFAHKPAGEETVQVTVRIRAARNRGGITAYMDGGAAVTPYKQRYQFITAYIPGLAGLAEKESILAQPTLRRQAASGLIETKES